MQVELLMRVVEEADGVAGGGEWEEGCVAQTRPGMIAADVEVIFVGVSGPDYAGFEVVAAWWSEGCIGG